MYLSPYAQPILTRFPSSTYIQTLYLPKYKWLVKFVWTDSAYFVLHPIGIFFQNSALAFKYLTLCLGSTLKPFHPIFWNRKNGLKMVLNGL